MINNAFVNHKTEFVDKLKARSKKLAVDTIIYCRTLPDTIETKILKNQLIRSASSVASNYRAACRARSGRDFYAKMSICIEESDETCLWLAVMKDSGIDHSAELERLHQESFELLSIFSTARKNTSI